MKQLGLLLLLVLSINASYAQTDSTQTHILVPKQFIYNLLDSDLGHIETLNGLLEKKKVNTDQMLNLIKAHTTNLKTQLLLVNLRLSESQAELYDLKSLLKKEKKKNFWRTVGIGAGSLAAGFIVGSLVVN